MERDGGGPSEPRGWQWFFRSLWRRAAAHGAAETRVRGDGGHDGDFSSDSRPSPAHLLLPKGWRIPWTLVVEGGQPRIWVGCETEGGLVELRGVISQGGSSSSSHSPLESIAESLGKRQKEKGIQYACVAYFNDGTCEGLTHGELSYLCRISGWRASLWGLQEYVEGCCSAQVTTSAAIEKRRKTPSSHTRRRPFRLPACTYPGLRREKDTSSEESANGNTTRCGQDYASGAELALACISRMLESDEPREEEIDANGPPLEALRLTELTIEWVVDERGISWLARPLRLQVRLVPVSRLALREVLSKERDAKSKEKARVVAATLCGLLRLAKERGLSSRDAFAHFSVPCDTSAMTKGLQSLGIRASRNTCKYLIEIIAGEGETCISEGCLWAYANPSSTPGSRKTTDRTLIETIDVDRVKAEEAQVNPQRNMADALSEAERKSRARGQLEEISPAVLDGFPTYDCVSSQGRETIDEIFSSPRFNAVATYRYSPPLDSGARSRCLVVAVCGLLQTHRQIQELLQALKRSHQGLAVLTVGLPGTPNTHWPADQVLDSSFQGKLLWELLAHLVKEQIIAPVLAQESGAENIPQVAQLVFLGCGPGAAAIFSSLLSSSGPGQADEKAELVSILPGFDVACVVAINGFLGGTLEDESGASLRALDLAMQNAAADHKSSELSVSEIHRLLLSRQLSPDGLLNCSDSHLKTDLELRLVNLDASMVHASNQAPLDSSVATDWENYVNARAWLSHASIARGMVAPGDERSETRNLVRFLSARRISLFLVQGSEDAVVRTPFPAVLRRHVSKSTLRRSQADVLEEILSPYHEGSIGTDSSLQNSRSSSLLSNANGWRFHVSWLKSGHDVYMERPGFILSLLDRILCSYTSSHAQSLALSSGSSPQDDTIDPFIVAQDERPPAGGVSDDITATPKNEAAALDGVTLLLARGEGATPPAPMGDENQYQKARRSDEDKYSAPPDVRGRTAPDEPISNPCPPESGDDNGESEGKHKEPESSEKWYPKEFPFPAYYPPGNEIIEKLYHEIEISAVFDLFDLVKTSHDASLRDLESVVSTVLPDVISLAKFAFDVLRSYALQKITLAEAAARDEYLNNSLDSSKRKEFAAKRECRYLKLKGIEAGPEFEEAHNSFEARKFESYQLEVEKAASCRRIARLSESLKESEAMVMKVMGGFRQMSLQANQFLAVLRIEADVLRNNLKKSEWKKNRLASREEELTREIERVAMWQSVWIDTDVWQPGQLQRIRKADLEAHLKREQEVVGKKLSEARETFAAAVKVMDECTRKRTSILSSVEALGSMTFLLERASAELIALPMLPRGEESAPRCKSGKSLAAGNIRRIPHHLRSAREKLWVGLDMKISPDSYKHVGPVEAQEMFWDAAYRSPLEPNDVKRLLALPSPVNIALPFLRTPHEVEAHAVLCEYTKEESDKYLENLDAGKENPQASTLLDKDESWRETLDGAKRGLEAFCTPICRLDEMQAAWWAIDSILRPQLHDPADYLEESETNPEVRCPPSLVPEPHCELMERIRDNYNREKLMSIKDACGTRDGDTYQSLVKRAMNVHGFPAAATESQVLPHLSSIRNAIAEVSGDIADLGRDSGTATSGEAHASRFVREEQTHPSNKGRILCNDLKDMSNLDPLEVKKRGVFILRPEGDSRRTLLEVPYTPISSGESRRHAFTILKEQVGGEAAVALSVSVVFRGDFEGHGYRFGRLGAALFRVDDLEGEPVPIGFSSHSLQSLNTHSSLGRLMIKHRPPPPIRPGTFVVLVGAASPCSYSVRVTAAVGIDSIWATKQGMEEATRLQTVIEDYDRRIDAVDSVSDLTRRKLSLVRDLVAEAQAELNDVDTKLHQVNCDLLDFEAEDASTDEAGAGLLDRAQILEEHREVVLRILANRAEEREDIAKGLEKSETEANGLRSQSESALQKYKALCEALPPALFMLEGPESAAEAGLRLNVTVNATTSDSAQWAAMNMAASRADETLEPSQLVRWRLRETGWDSLNRDEKEFCSLDRTLYPSRYDWVAADGQPRPSAESASEIKRIMTVPFSTLSHREVYVWKLMKRFTGAAQIASTQESAPLFSLASSARAKAPPMKTREDKEWATIEKILFPEYSRWLQGRGPGARTGHAATLNAISEGGKPDGDNAGSSSDSEGEFRREWKCPFSRERVMEIWESRNKEKGDGEVKDAKKTLALLEKYAGPFEVSEFNISDTKKVSGMKGNYTMTSSGRIALASSLHASRVCEFEGNANLRLRPLIGELRRTKELAGCHKFVDSDLLHAQPQRFPRHVYESALESEIKRILTEQVLERERALSLEIGPADCSLIEDGQVSDSTEGDCEDWEEATNDSLASSSKKAQRQRTIRGDASSLATTAEVQSDTEDEHGYCMACGRAECKWVEYANEDAISRRQKQLHTEIRRLQSESGMIGSAGTRRAPGAAKTLVETLVPLSILRGGDSRTTVGHAIREMRWESHELDRHVQLSRIDKELHDALAASEAPSLTIVSIHNYPTVMMRSDAIFALDSAREWVIARVAAVETVDDLLESMLEGWLFGERVSEYSAAGYVPGFKKSGPLRPGDQCRAVPWLENTIRAREEARQRGDRIPESERGSLFEKASAQIEPHSQYRIRRTLVLREESDRRHRLDTVDNTLRYGAVCLVLSFFHSMACIRREKHSWGGTYEAVGPGEGVKVPRSLERRKMIAEAAALRERMSVREICEAKAARGAERIEDRRLAALAERARRACAAALESRKRALAARDLQRLLRGYFGRQRARRIARQKAEIDALKAVLQAGAIQIQRVYRGHLARREAAEVRMELAEFMTAIRIEEAEADIADFWKTNPTLARRKKVEEAAGQGVAIVREWGYKKARAVGESARRLLRGRSAQKL